MLGENSRKIRKIKLIEVGCSEALVFNPGGYDFSGETLPESVENVRFWLKESSQEAVPVSYITVYYNSADCR